MDELKSRFFEHNGIIQETNGLYRRAAGFFGLGESAFWIIYSLRTSAGPLTQSELCSLMSAPKQTVNSALKKLRSDGLISICENPGMREKPISLTESGKHLAGETVDRVISAELEAYSKLAPAELEELLELSRKLTMFISDSLGTLEEGRDADENNNRKP